jgi:thiamine-monophosphate kinase
MTSPQLGPGPEFDFIRAIARALGSDAGPLGDDCALIPDGATTLALSTDVSVEGVHFRRDWLDPREIGWRAAAGALSDLAAEGAEVIGVFAAVTAPRSLAERDLVALMRGVADAASSVGGKVLGGDLSAAPQWSVGITCVGRSTRPVTRSGARPGDGLWVTGALGAPRAALEAWLRGDPPSTEARDAFAHPVPRIAAGVWLAAHGATAMLDLSDGLAGDARHVAAASEVQLDVELSRLPVAPAVVAEAGRLGLVPSVFAAQGGEDYELLVALPAGFGPVEGEAFQVAAGVGLTRIGAVAPGAGVRLLLGDEEVSLPGFDHFR